VVLDGDPSTIWQTDGTSVPRSASLVLDLGADVSIGTVRWLVPEAGFAGVVQIDVSSDRTNWTTVATPDAIVPGAWNESSVGVVAARYVRFSTTNPEALGVIGGIVEVEILP